MEAVSQTPPNRSVELAELQAENKIVSEQENTENNCETSAETNLKETDLNSSNPKISDTSSSHETKKTSFESGNPPESCNLTNSSTTSRADSPVHEASDAPPVSQPDSSTAEPENLSKNNKEDLSVSTPVESPGTNHVDSSSTKPSDSNGRLSSPTQNLEEDAELDDLPVPEECDELAPPLPPDGGWGWVVVIASLLINTVVDGVSYSFGVFYIEYVEYFGESRAKIAWVGSLVPGMYLGIGPIVGSLANKFGCRKVTIAGSIFASFSFFMSTFSPNVDVLIITFGIMGGIGFGLMYLTSIVICNFYFHRRRALATGIAVCGSGIGTFLFAPLSRYLLDEYGWKGANWIISGIVLNLCICGAAFRPLEARRFIKPVQKQRSLDSCVDEEEKKEAGGRSGGLLDSLKPRKDVNPAKCQIIQKIIEEKRRQRTISTGSLDGTVITRNNELIRDRAAAEAATTAGSPPATPPVRTPTSPTAPAPSAKLDLKTKLAGLNRSLPNIAESNENNAVTHATGKETPPKNTSPATSGGFLTVPKGPVNRRLEVLRQESGGGMRRRANTGSSSLGSARSHQDLYSSQELSSTAENRTQAPAARPLYRQDIFYSGSVANLSEYKSVQDVSSYVESYTSIPREAGGPGAEGMAGWRRYWLPALHVLREMFDITLLRSVTFTLLSLTSFFAMTGFFTPFVYITDRAMKMGIGGSEATFLLSIIGIMNILGRILSGFVSDYPWADCVLIHNLALVIAGGTTMAVPLYTAYWMLAVYCCVFGSCIAAFISLRSIVLVDLIGLNKLTASFGLLLLVQGLASIIGSPLSGAIFDLTGNYDFSFIVAGGFITVAGLISLPVRRIAACERKNEARKEAALSAGFPGSHYSRVSQTEPPVAQTA